MVARGQPLFSTRHPRPHLWVSGPDPRDHKIYKTWATSRAQAHFRNEQWDLTYEQYHALWDPHWENRGKKGHNVCLSRRDPGLPWDTSNAYIASRSEVMKVNILYNINNGTPYKKSAGRPRKDAKK